jgi:TPR repeat protein
MSNFINISACEDGTINTNASRLNASPDHSAAIVLVDACGEENEREAYRLEAEERHATAQFNLGKRYLSGAGVMKDERDAARWFQLAADKDFTRANIF